MPIRNPEQTTRVIINALKASAQRAVINTGWGGLGQELLPENVYKIDYVPYRWLFPRMKAVVHHGGSGTTAAGLRAGVPTLIIPFLFDQFFWANRVVELGAGPDPIPYRKLSSASLARGIDLAVNDLEIRKKSANISKTIHTEDGIYNAMQVIGGPNNA
jgi:sterol 3beta-glucosyltransferase